MPAACARVKPSMQLYRPPTLRMPDDAQQLDPPTPTSSPPSSTGMGDPSNKPGLNINAKEFVSLSGGPYEVSLGGSHAAPSLRHSKSAVRVSSGNVNGSLQHSKSGGQIGGRGTNQSPPLRVHFTDDSIAIDPADKVGMTPRSIPFSLPLSIKRSKSLGSAADLHPPSGGLLGSSPTSDQTAAFGSNAIADLGFKVEETVKDFHRVLDSPSTASARQVIRVVQHLFDRITEGTRFAEPAARYSIAVIEMEREGETFLESLLNTCQEYFQERDSLLKPPVPSSSLPLSSSHSKWVAYMTFLHEIYSQVKRRQHSVSSSAATSLQILSLLAECCVISLQDHVTGSASLLQTECLFFILTGVGRDVESELPGLMAKVMTAARDGLFACTSRSPSVKKTLLQLIEMNAASWQLPAQAVMYYYPAVGGN